MKVGLVVSLRVNPKDCQSVLDIMELIGFPTKGHSFSQLVSIAFSSLIETQRAAGNIPEPDPFQFLNRMQGFKGKHGNGAKAEITKMVHRAGPKVQAPALYQKPVEVTTVEEYTPPPVTDEQRQAGRRLAELDAKKELAQTNSAVLWSLRDDAEYQQLYKQVYGG